MELRSNIRNIYLVTAKQAGNNVRRVICLENGFPEITAISVRYKGKDKLVDLVDHIMRYTRSDAVPRYEKQAMSMLTVASKSEIKHSVDVGSTFVESVLRSKDARNCQKQLVDYMMAEFYLREAFDYDKAHNTTGRNSAVEKAKLVLTQMYSLNFISNFIFDGEQPVLDANLKEQLLDRAFDPLYSCTTFDKMTELANKKYIRDFTSRKDFFSHTEAEVAQELHREAIESRIDHVDPPAIKERIGKVINRHPKPSFGKDLYRSLFVKPSTMKRRRKFINLQQRHADILECSKARLAYKKQYASIDYGTKHNYINNYYAEDYREGPNNSKERYYFARENQMYGFIWNTSAVVTYKGGRLYFPDGAVSIVEDGMEPYEMLHRINAIYAALLGFTADDIGDTKDWMFNSVRSAYTDEGNAFFRLKMIEAREQGRM